MPKSRTKKILAYTAGSILLLVIAFGVWFNGITKINEPVLPKINTEEFKAKKQGPDFYTLGDSWLRKSESGLWEMYVTGEPYERGLKAGALSQNLIIYQEKAFIDEIQRLVPSRIFLHFLKYFILFFNRNITQYIPLEYQQEIYGLSKFASPEFSFIGDNYGRLLNYHAAHDIGHALQNMHMVGCTSFAAWNTKTDDKTIVMGRNFDFYVGDEFSKNKIVCFMKPDKGLKFAFITWGGMIGVVSGMNEAGLAVTINADKSEIPTSAKEPISLVLREILQYSRNIADALKILKDKQTFVSESILLSSAEDKKAVIIELKSSSDKASGLALVEPKNDFIVCSNQFLSDEFKNTKLNLEGLGETSSQARYDRTQELLAENFPLNFSSAASILRDMKGTGNKILGYGNEKAVNQLIAHHSVIFEPEKRLMWVSASPFQLGKFVCYDLNKIFADPVLSENREIYEQSLEIPPDKFLYSPEFASFKLYKKMQSEIQSKISNKSFDLTNDYIQQFISANPDLYQVYVILGDYFTKKQDFKAAIRYYNTALTKEVATANEKKAIAEKIEKCTNEINGKK